MPKFKYTGLIFLPIETDNPNKYFILLNLNTKIVEIIYDIDGKTGNSVKLYGENNAYELHNLYTERDMDEVQAIDNIYAHMYFDNNQVLHSLEEYNYTLDVIANDIRVNNSHRPDIDSIFNKVMNKTIDASLDYIEFLELQLEYINNRDVKFLIDTVILSDNEIDSIVEMLSEDEIDEIENELNDIL